MISKKSVFLFWGALDIFYIVRFAWLNISQGRFPLYDDVVAFTHYWPEQGAHLVVMAMFILSLLLTLSIPVSAFFLLKQYRATFWLVYLQTPARLLLTIPSLSFLPWLLKTAGIHNPPLWFVLVCISEGLKIWTLSRIHYNSKKIKDSQKRIK